MTCPKVTKLWLQCDLNSQLFDLQGKYITKLADRQPQYFILKTLCTRVVGIDQPYRNPTSKPYNGQVGEGLFQRKLILKAITTFSWHLKNLDCPLPIGSAQCFTPRSVNRGSTVFRNFHKESGCTTTKISNFL